MNREQGYFNKICTDVGTIIIIRENYVNDLWERRLDLAVTRKKERAAIFWNVFLEILTRLRDGVGYSREEMEVTGFWEYNKGLRKHADHEYLESKFTDAVKLFYDIRKNGMIDPIDIIINQYGNGILFRGSRRLAILKTLRTKKAKVRRVYMGKDGL
jgi:hypothetical protein